MKHRQLLITSLLFSTQLWAFDEVEITPNNPQGWQAVNVRDDGLVEHSKNQPLFGDGSLLFATDTQTNGQDKADYQFQWQQSVDVIDFPDRTLGNISDLSYAWYRDSASTTTAHFIPVFRLQFYDDGGSPANPADDVLGLLIWEGVYNGFNNPAEDTWELTDITTDNFWVFVSQSPSGSGVIQNFNSTLSDWITGTPQGQPGDPVITLTADTFIIGLNLGVGSGWGNTFIGYTDAVRVGFGSQDDVLYNFEVCDVAPVNNDPDLIFANDFECYKVL